MPLPTSCPRSRPATTRPHDHSNGNSPPPTSTTSSPGSTATPHNHEQHDPDELTIETTKARAVVAATAPCAQPNRVAAGRSIVRSDHRGAPQNCFVVVMTCDLGAALASLHRNP